tara:strand:- start:8362 stop:8673 length:312 start_codon:yes stop_codon:yes gene_type:complete
MSKVNWRVAGERGMELHGFFEDDSKPSIVIRTSSLSWDFEFDGLDGSGRVRVGAGCEYNPLQMVEAMWSVMLNHDDVEMVLPPDEDAKGEPSIEWKSLMEEWE